MNKNELIAFLRDPSKLTSSHLNELEEIIEQDPYFLSAHLLLAKGSKELKDPKAKNRVASAAIYSTDRILLKKYLSSNLFFLGQAVAEESAKKPQTKKERLQEEASKVQQAKEVVPAQPRADKRPSALKPQQKKSSLEIPTVPSGELDVLLDELKRDMENLRSSRHHFVEVQQRIEEEDAISKALDKSQQEEAEQKTQDLEVPRKENQVKEEAVSEEKEKSPVGHENIELDPTEEEIFSKKLAALAKKKEEDPKPEEEAKADVPPLDTVAPVAKDEPTQERDEEKDKDLDQADDERAEKSIDEPRFSRFATRSYLKDLTADFDDDFDFFEEKDKPKDSKPKSDKEDEQNEVTTPEETVGEQEEEEKPSKPSSANEGIAEEKAIEDKKTTSRKKSPSAKKAPIKKKKTATTKSKSSTETSAEDKPASTKTTKKAAPSKKTNTTVKEEKAEEEAQGDQKSDLTAQKEIIDKFIKESPSIKYVRKDEASTKDLGESSSEWDTNLASEYLAEIYLHQGNKKRAKEIYEALVLKYPEKKSYFADLISKIG